MVEKRKRSTAAWIALVLSVFSLILYNENPVMAKEAAEPENLYAQSAVLMDADSGRILFAKNGKEERAMASTTKIMTCILALENGDLSSEVTVSGSAASQPQVKLGMKEGQRFYLNDLLYSLMLESHNDSAAAIAEHISGSVEEFAALMNQKAKELDCYDTYFITPNGLDAQDANGIHHTTAEDLARIMRYCIMYSEKKEEFLEITRTKNYTFQDCDGNGSYTCNNHNAFLDMMEGALSGKTGFTADAGYCYVGALRDGERTFIVALLACGWPNNKGYKWSDTRALMDYGLENYYYRQIGGKPEKLSVRVPDGVAGDLSGSGTEKAVCSVNAAAKRNRNFPDSQGTVLEAVSSTEPFYMLLKNDEEVTVEYDVPPEVQAPVKKGEKLGTVTYSLDGKELRAFPVTAAEDVSERNFGICFFYIRDCLLL